MEKFIHLVDLEKMRENKYFLQKICFDPAENGPSKIWGVSIANKKSPNLALVNFARGARSSPGGTRGVERESRGRLKKAPVGRHQLR